ncbi:MAG TPA: hypothetical protein VKA76_12470 [Gammaproteobacteria bacterium]|nr:hypothetical protein [Gammaproteobacteria bacterium]
MSGSAVKLSMRLRTLIGQRVVYQDTECEILEVLDDGPAIVLRCAGSTRIIQPNQYGDASRRVPQTHTIPVFAADSDDPHPEFLALGLTDVFDD